MPIKIFYSRRKKCSRSNEPMSNEHLIEEYKALRREIEQYMSDNFRILEFSLTATAALFAVAFSEFLMDEARWLFLFTPCLVLLPCTLLIAQRIRQTWIIGRHIEHYLEPNLGFSWERRNYARKTQEKGRKIAPFALGSGSALVFIQVICPFVSGYQGYMYYEHLGVPVPGWVQIIWLILSLFVFASVLYQILVLKRAAHPEMYVQRPEISND